MALSDREDVTLLLTHQEAVLIERALTELVEFYDNSTVTSNRSLAMDLLLVRETVEEQHYALLNAETDEIERQMEADLIEQTDPGAAAVVSPWFPFSWGDEWRLARTVDVTTEFARDDEGDAHLFLSAEAAQAWADVPGNL